MSSYYLKQVSDTDKQLFRIQKYNPVSGQLESLTDSREQTIFNSICEYDYQSIGMPSGSYPDVSAKRIQPLTARSFSTLTNVFSLLSYLGSANTTVSFGLM